MRNILAVIICLSIVACGGHSGTSGRSNNAQRPIRILSESEKMILATTTIYYVETYSETDVNQCSADLKINMIDRQSVVLARVCKKVYDGCLMEGTCLVSVKNKLQMFNVDGKLNGLRRFRNITNNECKYGHGANSDLKTSYKNMCMDPFYSIAADLSIYDLGDVVYLPSAVGLALPTGEIHDGYFIVRDTGQSISGHGRFDFFTGFFNAKNANNPFTKIKFNDPQSFPEYFLADPVQSKKTRQHRNFPLLPKSN